MHVVQYFLLRIANTFKICKYVHRRLRNIINSHIRAFVNMCFICVCLRIVVSNMSSTIWVTWRVSYKRHELPTLPNFMGSTPDVGQVRDSHRFSFLCCVCFCFDFWFCFFIPISSGRHCRQCLWIVHSSVLSNVYLEPIMIQQIVYYTILVD